MRGMIHQRALSGNNVVKFCYHVQILLILNKFKIYNITNIKMLLTLFWICIILLINGKTILDILMVIEL